MLHKEHIPEISMFPEGTPASTNWSLVMAQKSKWQFFPVLYLHSSYGKSSLYDLNSMQHGPMEGETPAWIPPGSAP